MESWDREKERIRESARREAKTIVSRAKREADAVLEQLRRWARERPGELKEHRLIEAKKRLEDAEPETPTAQSVDRESTRQIRVGDEVLVRTLGQKGQVIDQLGEREFQVQVGIMKMKVGREQLEWKGSPHKNLPTREAPPIADDPTKFDRNWICGGGWWRKRFRRSTSIWMMPC